MENLSEPEVHDLIISDSTVQDGIKNLLNLDGEVSFLHEEEFINGITVDFTVVQNETIKALIECKSGDINVTEYVRGIGQLLQYEYFFEEKIPHKSYEYDKSIKTIYFYPSSVIKNNQFNISKFKYPQSTIIYELNENSHAVRELEKDFLDRLKNKGDNMVSVSPYYFRDNRVYEYYILINYLLLQEQIGKNEIFRESAELEFLRKIGTQNNNNWRNAFITIRKLGLINSNALLTQAGKNLAVLTYEKFAVEMYHAYMKPFFDEIIKCFGGENNIKLNNLEFADLIRRKYGNKEVYNLTTSEGRNISHWLNLMRDDYGIVSFQSHSKFRELKYNPVGLKDKFIEEKIKEYSVAYEYIKKYQDLLKMAFEGE